MTIELRPFTKDNLIEVSKLTTNTDNNPTVFEEFVASNAFSIAQASFYPSYITEAIYHEDEVVGFVMYGIDEDDGLLWIPRFMIDVKHQGKGLGKKSFHIVLKKLNQQYPGSDIYISFEPENIIAKHLYTSFGFKETGEINEGEVVFTLKN